MNVFELYEVCKETLGAVIYLQEQKILTCNVIHASLHVSLVKDSFIDWVHVEIPQVPKEAVRAERQLPW